MAQVKLEELYQLSERYLNHQGQEAFEKLVNNGERRMATVLLVGAILTKGSMNFLHLPRDMLDELLKSAGLELDDIYNPEL